MDGNTILDDDEDMLTFRNDDDDIEVSVNSRTKVGRF
jgi:hypothetical protein